MRALLLMVLAALLPGCATVVTGTTQTFSVVTEPPGADCRVERSGDLIAVINPTPGSASISKSSRDLLIRCTREGHETSSSTLSAEFQPIMLGNAILGGAIGIVVDLASGATASYQPSVRIALRPSGTAAAPPAQPGPGVPPIQPAVLRTSPPPVPAPPGLDPPPAGAPIVLDGVQHSGVLRFAERAIPLPPGTWYEVKRAVWVQAGTSGPDYLVQETALVRRARSGVDAVILVVATDYRGGRSSGRWRTNAVCTAQDGYAAVVREADERAQDCAALDYKLLRTPDRSSETWRAVQQLGEGARGALPATLLHADYRVADDVHATTVSYNFGVEAAGFPREETGREDSRWNRALIDPARQAHVDRLKAWMADNHAAIRNGALGRSTAALADP